MNQSFRPEPFFLHKEDFHTTLSSSMTTLNGLSLELSSLQGTLSCVDNLVNHNTVVQLKLSCEHFPKTTTCQQQQTQKDLEQVFFRYSSTFQNNHPSLVISFVPCLGSCNRQVQFYTLLLLIHTQKSPVYQGNDRQQTCSCYKSYVSVIKLFCLTTTMKQWKNSRMGLEV